MYFFIFFFFFNDTATTEIYTTEDTLPTRRSSDLSWELSFDDTNDENSIFNAAALGDRKSTRLNSVTLSYLVCRLLLEKKKKQKIKIFINIYNEIKKKKKKKDNII